MCCRSQLICWFLLRANRDATGWLSKIYSTTQFQGFSGYFQWIFGYFWLGLKFGGRTLLSKILKKFLKFKIIQQKRQHFTSHQTNKKISIQLLCNFVYKDIIDFFHYHRALGDNLYARDDQNMSANNMYCCFCFPTMKLGKAVHIIVNIPFPEWTTTATMKKLTTFVGGCIFAE